NSMHMNIEMTLRLIITPTTPIVNSTAESARYHESCGTIGTVVSSQWSVISSNSLLFIVVRGVRDAHQTFSLSGVSGHDLRRVRGGARIQNFPRNALITGDDHCAGRQKAAASC